MAGRSTQPSWDIKPRQPVRKWYQYLPIFKQGFEDQMAQYSDDYNQWALRQQQKYNEPKSMMARYQEAGLNPSLIYGDISSGNAGQSEMAAHKEMPRDTGNATGMVLDRFMDAKMKLAQIKDVEQAASLKKAQRDNLMAEIGAKDTDWYNRKGLKVDINTLTPRQRKYYAESMASVQKWSQDLSKATSENQKAQILQKINEVQNMIIWMNMVTSVGGMLGRFW